MFWTQSHLLYAIIAAISAVCTGAIAYYTGRRFWPSFWGGLLFGPLAVVIALIIFVPKRWRGVRW